MNESPRAIHSELLTTLGRIVVAWAYVESLEGLFLSYLLQSEPARTLVVTQNVSGSTITDWIRTLLQIPLVQKSGIGDLTNLLREIDDVRGDRNRLIHGLWSPGDQLGAVEVQTIRWDRTAVIKTELVTGEDLLELHHRAKHLVVELRGLGNRLGFHKSVAPAVARMNETNPLEAWFQKTGAQKVEFADANNIARNTLFDILGGKRKDYRAQTLVKLEKGTRGAVTTDIMIEWLKNLTKTVK